MLNNLKLMLGIASNDTDRDSLLKLIISNATARLTTLLGGLEPTESLDYIILDVCIRRFNRIGSEGMESHTVEGESVTFSAHLLPAQAERGLQRRYRQLQPRNCCGSEKIRFCY